MSSKPEKERNEAGTETRGNNDETKNKPDNKVVLRQEEDVMKVEQLGGKSDDTSDGHASL